MFDFAEEQPTSFMDIEVSINFRDPNIIHDRVLLVDGKKFYVNSNHLSLFAEYFNGLFNANFLESNQDVSELGDNIEAEDFDNFLRAIHPVEFKVTSANLAGLMQLSCRFLCPAVWRQCLSFLKKNDNFKKFEAREILEWSNGSYSNAIRIMIEKDLVIRYSVFRRQPYEQIKNVLELADEFELNSLERVLEKILFDGMRVFHYSVEELLYSAEEYEFKELKNEVENQLVLKLESFQTNSWYANGYKQICRFNLSVLKDKIREIMRQSIKNVSSSRYNDVFLSRIFASTMDETIKSNFEVLLGDIFIKDAKKIFDLVDYIKIAHIYNLVFLKTLIMDYLEEIMILKESPNNSNYEGKRWQIVEKDVKQKVPEQHMADMFLKEKSKKEYLPSFLVLMKKYNMAYLKSVLEDFLIDAHGRKTLYKIEELQSLTNEYQLNKLKNVLRRANLA